MLKLFLSRKKGAKSLMRFPSGWLCEYSLSTATKGSKGLSETRTGILAYLGCMFKLSFGSNTTFRHKAVCQGDGERYPSRFLLDT